MASQDRALIIAVENYPQAAVLAITLPGTNKGAADFYAWLRASKEVSATNIRMCCDCDPPGDLPGANKYGTRRDDIKEAVIDLVTAGRDKTGQLYVLLSGHGFGYEESAHRKLLDTFVSSDFRNLQVSGDKCIRIDELSEELWMSLGGADHFFFVDCCRNRIPEASARTGTLALSLDRAELGRPTKYMLYSTVSGEAGLVDSGFGAALLEGLTGTGRAKQFNRGEFWVVFDRLFAYTKSRLKNTQDVDRSIDGEGDGRILRIPDPKKTDCSIAISDCEPDTEFQLTVIKGGQAAAPIPFKGPTGIIPILPSDEGYKFKIMLGTQELRQIDPPANAFLDLYEPCTVKFQLSPTLAGGSTETRREILEGFLPSPVIIAPCAPPPPPLSRVCDSIAAHFPATVSRDGYPAVDFSETLGPVTERDPNLWLAWLGAARIIQPPGTYSKLGLLPLGDFSNEAPNSSPLYVLGGLEKSDDLRMGLGIDPEWSTARPVPGMRGVHELKQSLTPGRQTLISVFRPNQPVATFASFALPNRATFLVVSENAECQLNVQQFLLPIHTLRANLDVAENEYIGDAGRTLEFMRMLCEAEKQFSRRRSMGVDTAPDWENLLYGKWIDPLMALMAAFEMIRQGKLAEKRNLLNIVLGNMNHFFGAIPDVRSLARVIASEISPASPGVPLLREALMSDKSYQEGLPLPSTYLDYDSMWTSWRGAVPVPPI